MGLTDKRKAFVDEYFKDWNATQAAIRAGYSESTAYSQGARLLKNVEIAEAIQEKINERAMSAEEVLDRLADQARGVDSSYYNGALGMLYLDAEKLIADGKAHLIKKVHYDKDGDLSSVELYDSQAALVHLGRHHKLFTDKVDMTSGGQPIKGYVGVSPDDWDADGGDSDNEDPDAE